MAKIISQELSTQRVKMDEVIKDLHQMTLDIGHQKLAETVSELRNRIQEPFMFVVVGEVKAGKSSFVNALLGKDVCGVAPDPKTDTIQQIIYGEVEKEVIVNPFLKKIFLPVDILNEIAIVDTPGTNTISDHHQEITERFIPASDLIVFVFESKNPYRQSAWDFFNFIQDEWKKKTIFVLQQKDLMEPDDLVINKQGVHTYAAKKGIENPHVFAVSAKQEINGEIEESGFLPLREFITTNITGGRAPILKLLNNITTARNVNLKIYGGMQTRKAQWEADQYFRTDITETLDKQEGKSNYQVDTMVENLLGTYDRITRAKSQELADGLSLFSLLGKSIRSIFSKKESAQEWLNGVAGSLEYDLNKELTKKLNDGVMDIADSIQQMAKMIDLKIRNSKSILKSNHEIFSDIADRRASVLADLQKAFSNFMNRTENFLDEGLFSEKENFSPNLATGGGLAVIGVVLATVAQGAVFDITGGILTTVGVLFAGITVGLKRRKVLAAYEEEIERGKKKLHDELDTKLKTYVKNIKSKIDANFHEFDHLLSQEEQQITKLYQQHDAIEDRLDKMQKEIETI